MRTVKSVLATLAAATLVLSAVGCAPEPGDAAGQTDKDSQTINPETEWGGGTVIEEELVTDLPASFPSEQFALPDAAVIYNAGERGTDQWFVVFTANSADEADLLWNEIIEVNELQVSNEEQAVEGGTHATLMNSALEVDALTIPQEDGTVQMSYSIARWAE